MSASPISIYFSPLSGIPSNKEHGLTSNASAIFITSKTDIFLLPCSTSQR